MVVNQKYTTLDDIEKDNLIFKIIQEIMDEIGSHIIIYQNEEQFQFDLAWRINKYIDETSGIKVLLEFFSMTDEKMAENDDCKKIFTDIILLDDQNKFIPIELKYKKHGMKTIINQNNKQEGIECKIGHDGAANLGKFDYLWDIHRIEQLKEKPKNSVKIEDNRLESFVCGYAIMITNDNSYWVDKGKNCSQNMTLKQRITEIRWCQVKGKKYNSILDSKKYFALLVKDKDTNGECIDERHMPLINRYDFSTDENIITIKNYECCMFNPYKKTYKNKEQIEIKAFIAKIEK